MSYIIVSILALGFIALVASSVLYVCSRKFAVKTDSRVGLVNELLPKANCGGCGFAGCQALAEAMVRAVDKGEKDIPQCPVGGAEVMKQCAAVLGIDGAEQKPRVAVVRCQGCNLLSTVCYDGLRTCAVMNTCGTSESVCGYGCLGCGDCVSVCSFNGITIGDKGLPVIDSTLCVACGSCVKACPRNLIELRYKGVKDRRVYVASSPSIRPPRRQTRWHGATRCPHPKVLPTSRSSICTTCCLPPATMPI